VTLERHVDTVVIGAGPAGEVAAGRLAARGEKRVAIVEGHLIGGECSFYACMPSKALLRPPEALRETLRVPGAAEAVSGRVDIAAALTRRDEVIRHLDDSAQLPWLEDRGIELIRGWGKLDGERRVRVGDEVLVADDAVVIAVGSGALFPPIPGLGEVGAWSNRELTTTSSVPPRLLILGGGVVGVELAQAWAWYGSTVTVVEAEQQLLAREEPLAGEAVREALEEAGVTVALGAKAVSAERTSGGVRLSLDGERTLDGSHLLVAVGRRPLTEGLGLETVGLDCSGRTLEVDDHLRVGGLPWLYAVGDVNGRSLLTHSGKYQARVAVDCILGEDAVAWADREHAPRVVFTEPNVAAVGLTERQARERGLDVAVIDVETSATAGASFYGRGTPGTSRFIVDVAREVLVGVTFVGADVHEFVQTATLATVAEIPVGRIAHAIAPFPTRSELWLKFIEAYEKDRGRSVHTVAASRS
jgi:pyruvate/2-oxoglutarate dehydrogenase complex dihydrolipoamide dehydrogenase (E3) component